MECIKAERWRIFIGIQGFSIISFRDCKMVVSDRRLVADIMVVEGDLWRIGIRPKP